jgi:shikimate kinase / 3-dehydroquinate synthase
VQPDESSSRLGVIGTLIRARLPAHMQRPLFLSGFMATGKSSVGRLVAERTGRPFVDLDQRIEARAEKTVSQLFAEQGEAAFRALERAELDTALSSVADGPAPVVALGGGALVPRDLRLRALDSAVVVTLEASPSEIVWRAGSRSGRPLLDHQNGETRVRDLLEQRTVAYAECHGRVPTDGKTPSQVADAALEVWRRDGIAVAAGLDSYTVEVGSGTLGDLPRRTQHATSVALVTDSNVGPLHAGVALSGLVGQRVTQVVLEAGERHKHIGSVERIWQALLAAEADRKTMLVGLGGGVVTDITGFAASTWMRGVPWIGVPTTLLAMVDASVGGKTGVDLALAKNAVGAFYQPSGVLCDVSLEATEPLRGYVSALAEVVKTALIGDPGLFELLERETARVCARDPELLTEMVRRSVRVKARIVAQDPRESGLRAVLNLGHTVGHALEAEAGFEGLTHGEAVSLGLVAALRLGEGFGKSTPPELRERVVRLLGALGLPVTLEPERLRRAAALIGHDKKRAGKKLKFVVAYDVGRVDTADVELSELRGMVERL